MSHDTATPEQKHALFVERTVTSGTIWGLKSSEGWAMSYSNDDDETIVIPFWSDKEAALALAKEEWAEYAPEEIELSEFLDQWVFGMTEDEILIGTNWDQDMAGMESQPFDLALELVLRLKADGKEVTFPDDSGLEDYEKVLREAMEDPA